MSEGFTEAELEVGRQSVLPEWIDYNGHMNVAYYVLAFDRGVDEFMDQMGITPEYLETERSSTFTLEMHINYLQELHLGEPIRLTCQLLDADSKRVHYFLRMFHAEEGYLAATSEQMMIHVSLESRRSSPFPLEVSNVIDQMMAAHKALPFPDQAGQKMAIRRA
ncbi:MAG TPA: thioesterase [Gammaproteobacteria bacterium]|jgi:acyl-CoA thioester hydrolase|nr:thioesterase [Acidiferrobacteraceae bacterium]MDP6551649.1 thioesterase family protein [Arenicellales bacterium]MDP6790633.1 thioesterase family protein [Arenicellales bacterium]MDP6919189.1 thioesterase family protein [Arenicellales bacterium]HCX88640.1 thioesterase [Gammaproteobacteria bacterium]|tara:strand:- start:1203 stop:1694 length:492 start_codon:yes stop_codon:yes gene_type:complete